MENLMKITEYRLVRKGVESNNHPAFIRDLVNSYTSDSNHTIQELNERMKSLGWNDIELDDHTVQLIMAISENNKMVPGGTLEEENIQEYLKYWKNGSTYLRTDEDNVSSLLPVPENSTVQSHIRYFNKTAGFLK
jgi:hypothetical protein